VQGVNQITDFLKATSELNPVKIEVLNTPK